MSRTLRFLLALLAGLAVLALAGAAVVQKTTRQWFDEDIALRVRLIATGAGSALLQHWSLADRASLEQVLSDIARDERIMAAAACGPDAALLARTTDYPVGLSCSVHRGKHARIHRPERHSPMDAPWSMEWAMPDGDVQVSAMPLARGRELAGFLVLIHDLSFIERREAKTRKFAILGFGILAIGAASITVLAAYFSRRGFRTELRRFILGKSHNKDFLPLVRDVRELVDRIAAEREMDGQGGAWSPQRLKQTLVRHFPGERVIVLANREPYIHQRQPDGSIKVMHPASGLVTAVEPFCALVRVCGWGTEAVRRIATSSIAKTTSAFRLGRSRTTSGASGSRPTKNAVTTMGFPMRDCGPCVTSPMRVRFFAVKTGTPTWRSTAGSPTPFARKPQATIPWFWCRTTTSPWRRDSSANACPAP
jgi:trehalose 6-phosphate synthase